LEWIERINSEQERVGRRVTGSAELKLKSRKKGKRRHVECGGRKRARAGDETERWISTGKEDHS
jgi:hypothetical protein